MITVKFLLPGSLMAFVDPISVGEAQPFLEKELGSFFNCVITISNNSLQVNKFGVNWQYHEILRKKQVKCR